MSKLDDIILYLDKNYIKEKVEINNGTLGMHYDGLIYDYYFENSIYFADYLNINEYFEANCKSLNYDEKKSFKEMLSKQDEDNKLKVIELIVNLLNKSTYDDMSVGKNDIKKILNVLNRIGVYWKLDSSTNEYHFQTEKIVGSGSYSDVIEVNSTVYKKRLKSCFSNEDKWKIRMKREYDNMKKLSFSDYILKVYSFDEEEYSYLMEVCECDLADYLKQNPNLTEEECFSIFDDILNGMNDAHAKSIIHRDLHLGNIMRKDGHCLIGDFGLSKDTMLASNFKSSDTPKNSNMFMDPVGKSDFTLLDKQSDIYSIGKIFEFILSDKSYSDKMSFIIEKCINRDRQKRYKNIYEIISDFDEVKNGNQKIISEEELVQNLQNSVYNEEIHDYILDAIRNTNLCNIIVYHKLFSFAELIIQFDESEQEKIWNEIYNYFVDSTGHGGFSNYDIYTSISYTYIIQSNNLKTRKIAKNVLEGCAQIRFKAGQLYNKIQFQYPELF